MEFKKIGKKWILQLGDGYTYQDMINYDYGIFKKLLENEELYKELLSSFRRKHSFEINVCEKIEETLKTFNIRYEELAKKLQVPDKDKNNKQRYLTLIGKCPREEFDLFLLNDRNGKPIYIREVINYLKKPIDEASITGTNLDLLNTDILKLMDALLKKGFLTTEQTTENKKNLTTEMVSSHKIEDLCNSIMLTKGKLALENFKDLISSIKELFSSLRSQNPIIGIHKKNNIPNDFLMYSDLSDEELKTIYINIEKLIKISIYNLPIINNDLTLRDIMDNEDSSEIAGYSLKEICDNVYEKLNEYIKKDSEEKRVINKLEKRRDALLIFKKFLTTDNTLENKISNSISSEFINKILQEMPSTFDSYQQAYYIYKTLAQIVIYDSKFYASGQKIKRLALPHESFAEINTKNEVNNEFICYDVSVLLAALLEKIGYYVKIVNVNYEVVKESKGGHHHVFAWNGKHFLELDLMVGRVFDIYSQKINNIVDYFELRFSTEYENFIEKQREVDKYFDEKYDTASKFKNEILELRMKYSTDNELSFEERLKGFLGYFKNYPYDIIFMVTMWNEIRDVFFGFEYASVCDVTFGGYKIGNDWNMICIITYNENGIDKENGENNNYLLCMDCHNASPIQYNDLKNMVKSSQFKFLNKDIPGISNKYSKKLRKK